MALVFKVGENKDFVPVPQGFPQCQDYMPETRKFDSYLKKIQILMKFLLIDGAAGGASLQKGSVLGSCLIVIFLLVRFRFM